MKAKVVSFSGGRTSAYLVHLMEQKRKAGDDVHYVFMDTGAEHQKTYDFVRNIIKQWAAPVTCLRLKINPELGKGNGFTVVSADEIGCDLKPWKDMLSKYGVPYTGGMFCTDRMKLGPFTKFCNSEHGKRNYETWLGIRADEPARIVGANLYKIMKHSGMEDCDIYGLFMNEKNTPQFDYFDGMFVSNSNHYSYQDILEMLKVRINKLKNDGIRFLAEISEATKQDILNWWSKQGFDLGIDEWLGNCVFCPKKSNLKLAAAASDEHEMLREFWLAITDDSVRVDDNTGVVQDMYRGHKSLLDVIAMFDGSTGNEIKSRIRGGKMVDTGSCSESCEVFLAEANE